jgi:hypothetical protein
MAINIPYQESISMTAMIRASGTDFDPDQFCFQSRLDPCELYHRGDLDFPESQPDGRRCEHSGINIVASDAEFDEFDRQVDEAAAFLKGHHDELSRLRDFPGIEGITIDFGVEHKDVYVECYRLSPELIRLAGELGMSIEISLYPVSDDGDEPDQCLDDPS